MHARTRIVALCLSLLAVAAIVGAGTAAAASRVVGHLYVNDNTAGPTRSPGSTATPTAR